MINTSTPSASSVHPQQNTAFAWQKEVTALRENYRLIGLLLRESAHLPASTLAQYRTLQQLLIKTMEHFLVDLDRLDSATARQQSTAQQVLKKHVVTMQNLNLHVDSITRVYKA